MNDEKIRRLRLELRAAQALFAAAVMGFLGTVALLVWMLLVVLDGIR